MTTEKPPVNATPEAPAADAKPDAEDGDDDSFLDSLIESITEIPHWLFRPLFGKRDKD